MRNEADFKRTFDTLTQSLDAMSDAEFFAMLDISLEDLPDLCQKTESYSLELQNVPASYHALDLLCA